MEASGKPSRQDAGYITDKAATGDMSHSFDQRQGWLQLRIVAAVGLEQLFTEASSQLRIDLIQARRVSIYVKDSSHQ